MGNWRSPEIIAFEYGGTGTPFVWRSESKVLLEQVPRLIQWFIMATAKTHPDNDPFGEKVALRRFLVLSVHFAECRLRFPAPEMIRLICPICRSPVERTDQWQVNNMDLMPGQNGTIQLSVVLDNLRSAYNVGSILRTADGAGFKHAYLCGITPTPDTSPSGKNRVDSGNSYLLVSPQKRR